NYALWVVGLVAAVFTAFYMTRQMYLVFAKPERFNDDPEHEVQPHESPPIMLIPLIVLAGLSILGGLVDFPFLTVHFNNLDIWLEPVVAPVRDVTASSFLQGALLSGLALVVALVGLGLGRAVYRRGLEPDGTDPQGRFIGGFQKVLANAYYVND